MLRVPYFLHRTATALKVTAPLTMKIPTYTKIHNVLMYQAIWFVAVLGTIDYQWLLALLLLLHVVWSGQWQREMRLMLLGAGLGGTIDAVFTGLGVYVFSSSVSWSPIPLWLIAIWMGFCGTLRHSLRPLVNKPFVITGLAAVGAPMSYLAAQRFGAVDFPLGGLRTAIMVGMAWVVVMPALAWLSKESSGANVNYR